MRINSFLISALSTAAMLFAGCGDDEKTPAGECRVDADCAGTAVVACQVAVCNTDTKTCGTAPAADGTACSTGNACLSNESCTAGACVNGTVKAPECGTRECGNDACGNKCGDCEGTEICSDAGQCETDPTDCGEITFEGCCSGTGQLKYCNEGVLEVIDCPANAAEGGPATCGWFEGSGYDCSNAAEADASGAFPWLCPGETCAETCGTRECGFVCGQACGSGCEGNEICSPEGQCIENPCGEIGFLGCCNANGSVTYCDTEAYELITVDCKAELGPDATCGWEGEDLGYWCSNAQTSDPSGTLPYLCGGETCTETCENRACGSVCGQTCTNTCEGGLVCDEPTGTCIENPCGNLGFEGCCDGASVFWCEDFKVQTVDCGVASEGDPELAKCGWGESEAGAGYLCGPDEGSDPGGTLVRDCGTYTFTRPTPPEEPAGN
jgi:hypothetical protein